MTPSVKFIDLFCGGGGSGSGILDAYKAQGKRSQGLFINHWDQAINIHSFNHPDHLHLCTGVDDVDPEKIFHPGEPLNFLWASPACTHHSIARGGKPMNEQSRATAWCVIRWIRHRRPDHVIIENVREFLDWGPLTQKRCKKTGLKVWVTKLRANGKVKSVETTDIPLAQKKGQGRHAWLKELSALGYEMSMTADPKKKGQQFKLWAREIRRTGFRLEFKVLCSADYGDPTSRRRLYVNCVKIDSGKRVVWPTPTHAKPAADGAVPVGREPWRSARSIIQWEDIGKSIFTRKKPLSQKTLRRIAIGLERYGLRDFMMPQQRGGAPVKSIDDPLGTITSSGAEGVVQTDIVPFILPQNSDGDRVQSAERPVPTLTTESRGVGVVSGQLRSCLIQQQGASTAQDLDQPLNAVLGGPKHYVLNPALVKLKGTATAGNVDLPLDTIAAQGLHHAIMQAFLVATDQQGSNGSCTYSVETPIRTMVTKANQAVVMPELTPFLIPQFGEAPGQEPRTHSLDDPAPTPTSHGAGGVVRARLEPFLLGTAHDGGDASWVKGLLEPLATACGNRGDQAIVRPWLYTYYSSGSAGSDIDNPAPTSRTKGSMGVCYPVVEFNGSYFILDVFFRMLNLRELARAQGFDDWTFLCYGRGWLESSKDARSAKKSSERTPLTGRQDPRKPAVTVNAQINCVQNDLVLHSAEKSSLSANIAGERKRYPLPVGIADSVRQLAGMLKTSDQIAVTGEEESRMKGPDSTSRLNGKRSERSCGKETVRHVDGAGRSIHISLDVKNGQYTTLEAGRNFQKSDLILKTLLSFVANAIGSFIPKQILRENGFEICLSLVNQYEFPGTKTDAVKAIGNSVSCGVARALVLAATSQNPDTRNYTKAA